VCCVLAGWEEGERYLIACSNEWKNSKYLEDDDMGEKLKQPEYWQAHASNKTGLIVEHKTDLREDDIPAEFRPSEESKD
jgi:hypothetical protein